MLREIPVCAPAGFTLLEVLVALGILAVVCVGTLGFLGAADAGGMLAGIPTGIRATRAAKDATAAGFYLQSVHEVVAARVEAIPPGDYCRGEGCGAEAGLPEVLADLPVPPSEPDQLERPTLRVSVRRWRWDADAGRYCPAGSDGCPAQPPDPPLTVVSSTLRWELAGRPRTLTLVRFVP